MPTVQHLLMAIAMVFLLAPGALACSCVRPETPEDHVAASDVILYGEVEGRIVPFFGIAWTKFKIIESFKGEVVGDTRRIMHRLAPPESSPGDCSVRYEKGARVFVFATYDDAFLWTSLCHNFWAEGDYPGRLGEAMAERDVVLDQ